MKSESSIPTIQRAIAILWPSFLVAGFVTVCFFMVFDPELILQAGGFEDISSLGTYTIAFFLLWLSMMTTCLFTAYFARPCDLLNKKAPKQLE
jgi:hypothetical protein